MFKKNSKKARKPFKFKMVSAFTMLMGIIFVFIVLSWILHASGVTVQLPEKGSGILVTTSIQPLGILDLFIAPIKGFVASSDIIIFILALGAFIYVVLSTKALEGFSQSITRKLKGKEIWAIPALMLFFSICGTTEGLAEESLGFYLICIPLMIAAGFDKITGFMIVLLGAGIGVMGSTVNPFLITVAANVFKENGFDQITVGSGLLWRTICWLLLTMAAIAYVMWYARGVKLDPSKSYTFSTAEEDKKYFLKNIEEEIVMNKQRIFTISIFAFTFFIMIMYLVGWDQMFNTSTFESAGNWINNNLPWLTYLIPGFGHGYLVEVAAFFLLATIICGAINKVKEEEFIRQYLVGAADILGVCLVIATATGITIVLKDTHMETLLVSGLKSAVGGWSPFAMIIALFILFIPLSFLIPSTSGFAKAVFPLLVGTQAEPGVLTGANINETANGALQAFAFASGLVNFITPTSGVVMGALAIAKIDYAKFLKSIWPFMLGAFGIGLVLLSIGIAIPGKAF